MDYSCLNVDQDGKLQMPQNSNIFSGMTIANAAFRS